MDNTAPTTTDSRTRVIVRERTKGWAGLTARAAFVILVGGTAGLAGYVLANKLFGVVAGQAGNLLPNLPAGLSAAAISVAAIALNLERLVKFAIESAAFVLRSTAIWSFLDDATSLAYATFALTLGLAIYQHPPIEIPDLPTTAPVIYLETQPEQIRASLAPLVFFGKAGWDNGAFFQGVSLTDKQREGIKAFLTEIHRCAGGPDQPIEIGLRGFASSVPYYDRRGRQRDNSEELNRQAANLRARAAYTDLLAAKQGLQFGSELVITEPAEWRSYDEMARQRDSLQLQPDSVRAEASWPHRAVMIELVKMGRCRQLETPSIDLGSTVARVVVGPNQ
ncbi:hypothetical protein KF840_07265 [bacterium]|nr:hypothetical protein [bacterium]